ncbi:MAG: L-dopachrome tautomerase-related protein [Rikenellaceae bacterium]
MKSKFFSVASLAAISLMISCAQREVTPIAELVFSNESFIPANIAIADNGNMFLSVNPLSDPEAKLYMVTDGGSAFSPYPNAEYVVGDDSIIEGVLALNIDDDNNLWILDMVDPKFVVWDIEADTLVNTIVIPDEVLRTNSFLQDFVIDSSNDRLIIADMTMPSGDLGSYPAFVVYDMTNREFNRLAERHPSLMAEYVEGFGLNPIAIDPAGEWVYFGAMDGRKIYRAMAENFANEEMLLEGIELYGDKSYSDGIVVDQGGNIYVANIEDDAISLFDGENFVNIAMLPEGQSWPDGLVIEDGYIYATVSQLDKSAALNGGVDATQAPYVVVRTEIVED